MELYANRSGIEGTVSQCVRTCGLRRTRYRGFAKTHLDHTPTATAINCLRLSDWLAGAYRATTQHSRSPVSSPWVPSPRGIRQEYRFLMTSGPRLSPSDRPVQPSDRALAAPGQLRRDVSGVPRAALGPTRDRAVGGDLPPGRPHRCCSWPGAPAGTYGNTGGRHQKNGGSPYSGGQIRVLADTRHRPETRPSTASG
jgi:Transposase DDE domain